MGAPVGGQAVLDGVMMRHGPRWSLAVRNGDGTISVETDATPGWSTASTDRPLLRGMVALAETVVLGAKATIRASRKRSGATTGTAGEVVAVVLGAVFAVVAFGLLPAFLARRLSDGGWTFHGIEAVTRIGLLAGYLALLGRNAEIARVWGYHGAEHKAVNAHEAGAPLTVASIRTFSVRHRRCGTTFLLLVAVLAIGVHVVIGQPSTEVLLASRVLGLPLIAALAYEVIRVAGRPDAPRLLALLTVPGLWLQGLTTREPDDGQLEVALAALGAVVDVPAGELSRVA